MTNTEKRDEALTAFVMEPVLDAATLKAYVSRYPEFADDLVELSFAVKHLRQDHERASTEHDENRIESAWARLGPVEPAKDPLASLDAGRTKEVAEALGVPQQVILALREHMVIVTTLPNRFLFLLAGHLRTNADTLRTELQTPRRAVRSYSSDAPPRPSDGISFEQLLQESGVPEDRIRALLSEEA